MFFLEILGCFWYLLIAFSTGSEILETLLRYYTDGESIKLSF